jgi:Outer membrane protein beta-barrel domain
MSSFSGKFGLAVVVLAALCFGAPAAHAQAAPLSYWTPGWPVGFGGGFAGASNYGNFPSFDGDARNGGFSYNFPNGFFVRSGSSDTGLNMTGIGSGGAFGSFSTESTQFGYNFQNSPVKLFGGFDTLKYNPGLGTPFAAFDSNSSTTAGYSAYAGVEYKPSSNVSLSLGFGYTQTGDNTSAPVLPGTNSAFGARR